MKCVMYMLVCMCVWWRICMLVCVLKCLLSLLSPYVLKQGFSLFTDSASLVNHLIPGNWYPTFASQMLGSQVDYHAYLAFTWCWGLNCGLYDSTTNALLTEPSPEPLQIAIFISEVKYLSFHLIKCNNSNLLCLMY